MVKTCLPYLTRAHILAPLVHEATATVREALRFSAYLRQPFDVPQSEKDAYVEEIIELLELQDVADAMIGWVGFGLSVEVCFLRLTSALELIHIFRLANDSPLE